MQFSWRDPQAMLGHARRQARARRSQRCSGSARVRVALRWPQADAERLDELMAEIVVKVVVEDFGSEVVRGHARVHRSHLAARRWLRRARGDRALAGDEGPRPRPLTPSGRCRRGGSNDHETPQESDPVRRTISGRPTAVPRHTANSLHSTALPPGAGGFMERLGPQGSADCGAGATAAG